MGPLGGNRKSISRRKIYTMTQRRQRLCVIRLNSLLLNQIWLAHERTSPSIKREKWELTTSQSMPSSSPLPSMAEHATMLQLRSRSSPSFKASEISPAPLAPGWSCLLAKTRRFASRSSSSFSMAASSSAAVPRRSISVESITKITAAVLA